MARKTDFTAEEWDTIAEAPLTASLYITVAAPSIFGAFGEVMSATRSLVEGAQTPGSNELQNDILAEFKSLDTARGAQPGMQGRDPASAKAELQGQLSSAVALIDAKAGAAEASEVKNWIYGIAERTAQASKEGGFLGIGGVRVSEEEQAALTELAGILGVTQV